MKKKSTKKPSNKKPQVVRASKDSFKASIGQLHSSIALCLNSGFYLSALILIYSGIDILANLNRPKDKDKAGEKEYCKWCDDYVLPNTQDIFCDSIDIYAARCAVVHSYGYKTELTTKEARLELWLMRTGQKMQLILNS